MPAQRQQLAYWRTAELAKDRQKMIERRHGPGPAARRSAPCSFCLLRPRVHVRFNIAHGLAQLARLPVSDWATTRVLLAHWLRSP